MAMETRPNWIGDYAMKKEGRTQAVNNSDLEVAGIWTGRRVAITGGTSGLGQALVTALIALGVRVALVARNPEPVELVGPDLSHAPGVVGSVLSSAANY